MALVQSNTCDPFDRISQREVLARILRSDDVEPEETWTSDSEHEFEEQGKDSLLSCFVYEQTFQYSL